jgi:hypothetical protein
MRSGNPPSDCFSTQIPIRDPNRPIGRWPRHIKARHRIQRAFHNWYGVNRHAFLLPLDCIEHSKRALIFGFAGVTPMIKVRLTRNDLSALVLRPEVARQDECLDMLFSFDTSPKRVSGGYICTQCDPGTRPTLPSREAIWEADLFEPFLVWVNEVLAVATTLEVVSDGSSWANLLLENGTEARLKFL